MIISHTVRIMLSFLTVDRFHCSPATVMSDFGQIPEISRPRNATDQFHDEA